MPRAPRARPRAAGESRTRRTGAVVALALALAAAAGGCGVPADPDGTLARIDSTAVLRAGASPAAPLVITDGGDVSGAAAELIEGFAVTRDARVMWTVDSEEDLVDQLEAGTLDVAVGGMTTASPWADRASLTRGYTIAGIPDVVVLLPLGENATQSALERYLDGELG